MDLKMSALILAFLIIALTTSTDATNYWRINAGRGRHGTARYTARSPRLYDALRSNVMKRYMQTNEFDTTENTAENTAEEWLRDWIVNNRDWVRATLFDDNLGNEI